MMENQARQFKHTQDAQEYQTDHKKASGKSIEHIGLDRQKKLERSLTGHQSSLLSQTCQYALIIWALIKRLGSGRILISYCPQQTHYTLFIPLLERAAEPTWDLSYLRPRLLTHRTAQPFRAGTSSLSHHAWHPGWQRMGIPTFFANLSFHQTTEILDPCLQVQSFCLWQSWLWKSPHDLSTSKWF